MGYELHITLADDWGQSAEHPIAEAAWRSVIDGDSSLCTSNTDYLDLRDLTTGLVTRHHPVIWNGHPAGGVPFWFIGGQVTAKNPDAATIAKMKTMAQKLGARLQGDDGEEY